MVNLLDLSNPHPLPQWSWFLSRVFLVISYMSLAESSINGLSKGYSPEFDEKIIRVSWKKKPMWFWIKPDYVENKKQFQGSILESHLICSVLFEARIPLERTELNLMMGQFAGNLVQPLCKVGFKKTWFPVGFPSNHIKPLSTPLKVEIPLYPIKNSHDISMISPTVFRWYFHQKFPWNPETQRDPGSV